ncbi:MAG: hypothetical protein ACR2N2_05625 [Acidimicrobiia bacterium]
MRQFAIVIATVFLSTGVYWGNLGLWFQSEIADEDAFVESAMLSFEQEGSYDAMGEIVAQKMLAEYPALALLGDSLGSLLGTLLATEPFEPALEAVARDLHDRLFNGTDDPVLIDLAEYEDIILSAVEIAAPGLVGLIPDDVFRTYVVFEGDSIPDLASESDALRRTAVVAVIVGLAAAVALVALTRQMWELLAGVGVALLLAGGGTALSTSTTRETVRALTTSEAYRTVVLNLYDVLVYPLQRSALFLAIVGGVLSLAAIGAYLVQWRRGRSAEPAA